MRSAAPPCTQRACVGSMGSQQIHSATVLCSAAAHNAADTADRSAGAGLRLSKAPPYITSSSCRIRSFSVRSRSNSAAWSVDGAASSASARSHGHSRYSTGRTASAIPSNTSRSAANASGQCGSRGGRSRSYKAAAISSRSPARRDGVVWSAAGTWTAGTAARSFSSSTRISSPSRCSASNASDLIGWPSSSRPRS